jgi:hypothetical protein
LKEGLLVEIEILWGPKKKKKEHSWIKESGDTQTKSGWETAIKGGQGEGDGPTWSHRVHATKNSTSSKRWCRTWSPIAPRLRQKQNNKPVPGFVFRLQGLTPGCMC